MTERHEQQLPLARRERLLIEELSDEVLVYDLDRKKAHCLNQTAALIWNHCDGKTSLEAMAVILQDRSEVKVDHDVVWYGLDQLRRARLIEESVAIPNGTGKVSRRELIRRLGLAVSIPTVVSILAPKASAALSCVIPCVNPGQCVSPCTTCTAGLICA